MKATNEALDAGIAATKPGNTADDAGFQMATLPIKAGAEGRLPPIEAKLNGDTAKIKPSRGLISSVFVIFSGEYMGWCWLNSYAYQELKRKKSISSQAASISD